MSEKFRLVSPRSSVEIHLSDGRILSGPRSAKVEEFLSTLEFPAPLVAAVVNGDLRELTFPIEMRASHLSPCPCPMGRASIVVP